MVLKQGTIERVCHGHRCLVLGFDNNKLSIRGGGGKVTSVFGMDLEEKKRESPNYAL
jgi:hypothetical protein